MGGTYLLKLNIGGRLTAYKYREGKMKRTLRRELKVPEIAEKDTNGIIICKVYVGCESGPRMKTARVCVT